MDNLTNYNLPEGLTLKNVEGRLTLVDESSNQNEVSVNFDDVDMRLIRKSAHNTNQPMVKALGKQTKFVVDLTCGYGKDAYLLLCTGRQVIGVERNPVIHALLKNGVERARLSDEHSTTFENFKLINCEARKFVSEIEAEDYPDAYYIDPMYPPRNTSALPKKEIQVLRHLLSTELTEDPEKRESELKKLIEVCLTKTKKRVVLKRPAWLAPLFPPKVSFGGKLVRYDVYVKD